MNELTEADTRHCANCGTPMQGEFCHHCGQSIHSVLRPVHHMVEDTMDMVLHVDSRIVHTLPPLLLKPGFLTMEYFAGRRVRYIAPFRLMFVLCLLAFFVGHLALGDRPFAVGNDAVTVNTGAFKQAKTPAEVDRALQQQLLEINQAQQVPGVGTLTGAALEKARQKLRQEALQRRAELGDKTVSLPDQPAPAGADKRLERPASPIDSSVQISWLPEFVNVGLSRMGQRMVTNLDALSDDDGERAVEARERLVSQLFATLPQALLFMLPLFALLLKVVYVFRRRLYMEHLIVALHSHAFLFLALLLGVLLTLLRGWLGPHAAWAAAPVRWVSWALAVWVPAYLLLMQKRIYRQGWPMTVLKYCFVGWLYLWLLGFTLMVAFMLGLAH